MQHGCRMDSPSAASAWGHFSPDKGACGVLTPLEWAPAAGPGIQPMLCVRIFAGTVVM